MQAEKWENEYGDIVVFVGNQYVIYDKCDRLVVQAEAMNKGKSNLNIEDYKEVYRKNGFKPVENKE